MNNAYGIKQIWKWYMVQNDHNSEYEKLLHEQLMDRKQKSEIVKRQCIAWLKENDMAWYMYICMIDSEW